MIWAEPLFQESMNDSIYHWSEHFLWDVPEKGRQAGILPCRQGSLSASSQFSGFRSPEAKLISRGSPVLPFTFVGCGDPLWIWKFHQFLTLVIWCNFAIHPVSPFHTSHFHQLCIFPAEIRSWALNGAWYHWCAYNSQPAASAARNRRLPAVEFPRSPNWPI